MNKKIVATIGVVILVASFLAISSVSGIPGKSAPKEVQDRLSLNKNPAPFENVRAPLSGTALKILENRAKFNEMGKGSLKRGSPSQPSPLAIKRNNLEGAYNIPQNEETIGVLPYGSSKMVVTGANDYRGFFPNFGWSGVSGYYVSTDNGLSTLREGSIPKLSGTEWGTEQKYIGYSGGDPAIDTHGSAHVYYSSMWFNYTTNTWAVGLAQAMPSDLADKSKTDAQVWKVKQIRADDAYIQANDKPWLATDNSGSNYNGYTYVSWTAFNAAGAKIWLARCSGTLSCTTLHGAADPVSGTQTATQMSMVNVDSAGRVVVTWVEYTDFPLNPSPNPNPPYYRIKIWYRVYAPGGASALTPPKLITTLDKPVSGYYAGLGNEFRIPANAWSETAKNGSTPRLLVAYFACGGSYLYDLPGFFYADTCSNIDSYIKYVDNYQSGTPSISSKIGLETSPVHSYFPTMGVNQPAKKIDIAYYQSEPTYKHDRYLYIQQRNLANPSIVTMAAANKAYAGDPDADVFLGGGFIGDYQHVVSMPGSPNWMYAAYNANTRFGSPIELDIGGGFTWKVGGYQDDNYLYTTSYS